MIVFLWWPLVGRRKQPSSSAEFSKTIEVMSQNKFAVEVEVNIKADVEAINVATADVDVDDEDVEADFDLMGAVEGTSIVLGANIEPCLKWLKQGIISFSLSMGDPERRVVGEAAKTIGKQLLIDGVEDDEDVGSNSVDDAFDYKANSGGVDKADSVTFESDINNVNANGEDVVDCEDESDGIVTKFDDCKGESDGLFVEFDLAIDVEVIQLYIGADVEMLWQSTDRAIVRSERVLISVVNALLRANIDPNVVSFSLSMGDPEGVDIEAIDDVHVAVGTKTFVEFGGVPINGGLLQMDIDQ